ncbi:hypothetical protein JM16_003508 [Phytophthora kernoviae]|uniref:PH domain-containing protein n=1 Tax=Phytophthora kernoviae TaxID=325452 RepID=A0A8T0M4P5_9STRA|nr:hypothetical protein JM16_003508 [Phytophthora kernoviae]
MYFYAVRTQGLVALGRGRFGGVSGNYFRQTLIDMGVITLVDMDSGDSCDTVPHAKGRECSRQCVKHELDAVTVLRRCCCPSAMKKAEDTAKPPPLVHKSASSPVKTNNLKMLTLADAITQQQQQKKNKTPKPAQLQLHHASTSADVVEAPHSVPAMRLPVQLVLDPPVSVGVDRSDRRRAPSVPAVPQDDGMAKLHLTDPARLSDMTQRMKPKLRVSESGRFEDQFYHAHDGSKAMARLRNRAYLKKTVHMSGNDVEQFSDADIITSGYLVKQGSFWKSWRRRFFILRRDRPVLCYYTSAEELAKLGEISIDEHTTVQPTPKEGFPFRFMIENEGRKLTLFAEQGEEAMEAWISCINGCITQRVRATSRASINGSFDRRSEGGSFRTELQARMSESTPMLDELNVDRASFSRMESPRLASGMNTMKRYSTDSTVIQQAANDSRNGKRPVEISRTEVRSSLAPRSCGGDFYARDFSALLSVPRTARSMLQFEIYSVVNPASEDLETQKSLGFVRVSALDVLFSRESSMLLECHRIDSSKQLYYLVVDRFLPPSHSINVSHAYTYAKHHFLVDTLPMEKRKSGDLMSSSAINAMSGLNYNEMLRGKVNSSTANHVLVSEELSASYVSISMTVAFLKFLQRRNIMRIDEAKQVAHDMRQHIKANTSSNSANTHIQEVEDNLRDVELEMAHYMRLHASYQENLKRYETMLVSLEDGREQGITGCLKRSNMKKDKATAFMATNLNCHLRYFRVYQTQVMAGMGNEKKREADATELAELQSEIEALTDRLNTRTENVKKKVVNILIASSDICRRLGAGRTTCCKSGKDRTAMSVTLETSRLLVDHFHVKQGVHLCNAMRERGVRRVNVLANTGKTKFAFNSFQLKYIPDCYKPPLACADSHVSS